MTAHTIRYLTNGKNTVRIGEEWTHTWDGTAWVLPVPTDEITMSHPENWKQCEEPRPGHAEGAPK